MRAVLAAGALLVMAAVIGAIMLAGSVGSPEPATGPLTVNVDVRRAGEKVPRSFLGLSVEYQSVPLYAGAPGRPNRAFRRLVGALGAAQRSPVALRIGGNSGDQSWWNPSGRPRPPGITYDVGPRWAAALAGAQAGLRAPLALGLNLALDDPRNALALTRAVRARVGPPGVTALEIGNEPDVFVRGRTFRVGRLVMRRPRHRQRYGPDAYVREATRYIRALSRGLEPPLPRLSVGGFATGAFLDALPPLLSLKGAPVREVTAHAYAIRTCNADTPAGELRARLLTDAASRGLVRTIAPALKIARESGVPLRVSEMNSAVCGGAAGVSDAFAAALWAPDALFALARAGVRRVNLHTWDGAYYAPFAFRRSGRRDVARVRPLYHGLALFARAAPAASRLVGVRLADAGQARAWATVDAHGTVRVLVLNRSASARRAVRVRLGPGGSRGHLRVLRAPGLAARGDATLRPAPVQDREGERRFVVPAAGAALLTVRARSR